MSYEFQTFAEMSPEKAKRAHLEAIIWARRGFATWRNDKCSRCKTNYVELSPLCQNARIHEKAAAQLVVYLEQYGHLPLDRCDGPDCPICPIT